MKQRYFSSLLLGLVAMGLNAQTQYTILEDLTSKIQNANFSADTPVGVTIRTYDYDMPDNGAGADGEALFGQQPVVGWVAATPTDNTKVSTDNGDGARTDGLNARAAGIFAFLDTPGESTFGLGGDNYFPPAYEDGVSGNALGLVAVWGADLKYTQDITLPAGDYMLIFSMWNGAGTGTLKSNNFGFTATDGTPYLSSTTSYPQIQEWFNDTIFIRLSAETAGQLSMGYSFASGSGSAPHLFVDDVKLYKIDPSALDKQEVDALKEVLFQLIEDGNDLGANTDEAQSVYDNENATLAQVQAAIDKQREINNSMKIDLSEFFIKNPHFTADEPVEGGICTYDYDCVKNNIATTNYSMLPLEGWTRTKTDNGVAAGVYAVGSDAFLGGAAYLPPTEMSDGATEGKVLGFVSCWSATAAYQQSVTIPAGDYVLTISLYNSGGAQDIAKNLIGFIAANGTEYLGQTKNFPVGKWMKETIKFTLDEETSGYFTMGYQATNTGSGNMPHFFIDGISLEYTGELNIDPSLFALQAVVKAGESLLNETSDFYSELQEQFASKLDQAREMIENTSDDADANRAITDELNALMEQVRVSAKAYADLKSFFNNELNAAIKKYSEFDALSARLGEMAEEIEGALDDLYWDNDKIAEVMASLDPILKEEIQKAWDAAVTSGEKLENSIDITPLFEQMAYTYSTSVQQGANVPDKEWQYGSASNFKTQYGTAEVWNQSPFTVSRTLSKLPAGRYTITTKAFYRTADNVANLDGFDPENNLAFVFAGRSKTALANVAEIASDEEIEGWAIVESAETKYVPNSQQVAHDVFENPDYTTTLEKTVSTSLVEAGDLTFGITADAMESNSWVVWYSFSIAYNAVEEADVLNELTLLVQEAEDLKDNSEESEYISYVTKASEDLASAIEVGQKALSTQVLDDVKSAITALTEAMAYASESATLVQQFSDLYQPYSDLMDTYGYPSTDDKLQELLDMAGDQEAVYESNEQLKEFIDGLPLAWFNYVMSQELEGASETSPIDITGVILNPTFEGNIDHWNIIAKEEEDKIGQNQGFQSNSEYKSEDETIIVSQFVEAWRPNGEALHNGEISQELLGVLPEGYYVLEVDAYATNQSAIPEEGIQGANLYAQNGAKSYITSVGIGVTSGTPAHFQMAFYSDGVEKTKVGLYVQDTNASWIVADNFMLSYVGTTAPETIELGADGIANVATAARIEAIYTLSGARQNTLVRGLNIVKMADGTVRKLMVK